MLRVAQRRGLGVDHSRLFADVGLAQDSESLGVSRHQAILDTVVDHLDEVAGAVGSTVKIAQLSGAFDLFAPRRRWNVPHARRQAPEDWIETVNYLYFAADHHAVASVQAPHAAAGAHIH